MKERNHAFDFLCAICIVRMITLHIMNICGQGENEVWQQVMQGTYFFMSFFFFKAGYFNKGVRRPTRPYLWDRVRRLLVPYFCWGLIGNIVYFAYLPKLLDRYHNPIEPLSWEHIWRTGSFYGNSPTWFLLSFFLTYVVVHFLEKVRFLPWLVLAFPAVSIWLWKLENPLWFSLNNVFMGVWFFYLGRSWHWIMNRLSAPHLYALSVFLVMGFGVCNFIWGGRYTMSGNTFQGNPWLVVLTCSMALCGIAGLLLSFRMPRIPVINFIGEHSMVFFVCHYPMLYFYKFTHLSFGRSIYGRWDDVLVLLPIIFCLCAWLVPYIERVPWLSGRLRAKEGNH
ncbi:MAG: acyltransferase [Bacteroidaceae bacterium]|nr:acyltransferase [Bacteroidaceae bacterium]